MFYLKRLSAEIKFLLLPSIFLFLVTFFASFFYKKDIDLLLIIRDSINMAMFGGSKLFLAFIVFFIILSITILGKKDNTNFLDTHKAGKSLLYVTILVTVISFFNVSNLIILTTIVSPNKVLSDTLLIDNFERNLFGVLPAIPLINALSGSFLEKIIFFSYNNLPLIFSISLMLLAFKNKIFFRKSIFSFLLAFTISFPIFFIISIVSPDALYVAKIFGDIPMQSISNLNFSEIYQINLNYFHQIWISQDNSFFSISSMPSLHVIWGFIATFYISKIYSKIKWFFIIWFLFSTLGTFYSMQHYFLDVVGGFIFGIIIIFLTEKIFEQKKEISGHDESFFISDLLIVIKDKTRFTFSNFCSKLLDTKL